MMFRLSERRKLSLIMVCAMTATFVFSYFLRTMMKELHSCCNANQRLLVTRENTELGKVITYEAERANSRKVDKDVFDMLPEAAPQWTGGQLRRCAVVGNGGILRNSSCGVEIDSADFVIRFNLAPMNYSSDIGVKSDVVTVNPSQITSSYRGLFYSRKSFMEQVALYGNADLIVAAFSYKANTDICFRAFHTVRDMRPQQGVLFLNPDYLLKLDGYWRGRGLKAKRLSSGFMLVNVALELCDKLDLYGFWPFNVDPRLQPLPHHYYDNVGAEKGVHAMPEEFLHLLQMHSQGVLELHVGKCR